MMNIEDDLLENIEWDKDKPWSGIITLANGKTARVELDVDETDEPAARNTLKFLIANEAQIRHKIAISLFKHLKDWIPDYITVPEQLAQRINLSDILFGEGGGGQLYFYANGDDNLFTSHAICVWFDADGEIDDEVELAG